MAPGCPCTYSGKRLKAESQQLSLGKKNGTHEEKGRETTIFEQEKKQMHTTVHRWSLKHWQEQLLMATTAVIFTLVTL